MSSIILTGFQPFGPYEYNPTVESTLHFDKENVAGHEIIGVVLESTYRGAFQALQRVIDDAKPVAIISTGLSSTVPGIRIERTARNMMMHEKYADANGYAPNGEKIIAGGDEFIDAHSNGVRLANALHKKGIKTELSANANTFICNSLLYLTTDYINRNRLKIANTFIHVPWTDNFAGRVKLETGKIMIPQKMLHDAINTLIMHI